MVLAALASGCVSTGIKTQATRPDGRFVSMAEIDSTVILDMRYYGNHNFLGRRVKGYGAPKCLLTREAAKALAAVQAELLQYDLGLKIYDCYRPQRAVDDFVEWAKDISDTKMKAEFYPRVDKTNLFKDGYIAARSGHSRGSTMDLTIVPLPVPKQPLYQEGQPLEACYLPYEKRFQDNSLDMGTGFDCFDPLAHTANFETGPVQERNRLLLKSMMEKNGFKNLPEEWWHFTLVNEPFPGTYFDFDIE